MDTAKLETAYTADPAGAPQESTPPGAPAPAPDTFDFGPPVAVPMPAVAAQVPSWLAAFNQYAAVKGGVSTRGSSTSSTGSKEIG